MSAILRGAIGHSCGFTLVEVLGVIAALAVISGIGIVAVSNTREAAAESKLEQDVESLNRSVQVYIANGGNLTGITETDAVLTELKKRSDRRIMGVSGSVVDERLVPNYGNSSSQLRAVWRPSPDNRFELVQGTSGVVEFRLDESIAANAAATESDRTPTKELATTGGWVWDNSGSSLAGGSGGSAGTGSGSGSSPAPGTGTTFTGSNGTVTALAAPTISPSGSTFGLSTYPKTVTITNSNPAGTSQIYYSVGGGGYALYTGPISASPGQVSAMAVTLDPSRYSTSPTRTESYYAQPTLTWTGSSSLNYTQASSGNSTASVAADGNGTFTIRYTTDGSTPTASSPAYSGNITLSPGLWTSSTLTLNAKAFTSGNNSYYLDSAVATKTITATTISLNAPTISPGSQIVFGSIPVTVTKAAADPAGTRLFYTTTGATPTSSSTLYSGPFVISGLGVNEQRVVKAIASGPSGSSFWFTDSTPASVTYTGLNFDYYNLDGVLIGGGTINNNAALNGSVVLVSVNGVQPSVTFDNNSVLEGDIYAPGTPTIVGVSPASRIINLDGAVEPTNYTITMNKASFAGNVYRRITPVTMPVVTHPTGLVERGNATTGTLLPGHYNNLNGTNGGTFTLGVAGSTTPSIYVIDNLTIGNNTRLNIVGPVTLTLDPGSGTTVTISNNAIIGNSAHPEWLQIDMNTGNLTVGNNGFLYGSVLNPNGAVTFENNSVFTGGVTAKFLSINNNGSGITFSLPPPSSP